MQPSDKASVTRGLLEEAQARRLKSHAEEYGVFSAVDVEEHFRRLKGCVDVNMQHAAWNANLDKRGVRAYTTDGRTHFEESLKALELDQQIEEEQLANQLQHSINLAAAREASLRHRGPTSAPTRTSMAVTGLKPTHGVWDGVNAAQDFLTSYSASQCDVVSPTDPDVLSETHSTSGTSTPASRSQSTTRPSTSGGGDVQIRPDSARGYTVMSTRNRRSSLQLDALGPALGGPGMNSGRPESRLRQSSFIAESHSSARAAPFASGRLGERRASCTVFGEGEDAIPDLDFGGEYGEACPPRRAGAGQDRQRSRAKRSSICITDLPSVFDRLPAAAAPTSANSYLEDPVSPTRVPSANGRARRPSSSYTYLTSSQRATGTQPRPPNSGQHPALSVSIKDGMRSDRPSLSGALSKLSPSGPSYGNLSSPLAALKAAQAEREAMLSTAKALVSKQASVTGRTSAMGNK